ncbi:MAG: hypothetical protein JXR76_17485 [Deltaproteobacteria bacterium]|nr:hypothetical protein [Deltaproteobacteria bacterium]
MNHFDKKKLNRLLTPKSELSVQEKEAMLASLLGPSNGQPEVPSKSFWRQRWVMPVLGSFSLVMLATAVLIWNRGLLQSPGAPDYVEAEYVARGGVADTPSFGMKCVAENGAPSSCTVGMTLVFDLFVPNPPVYFSAASVSRTGVLVRYFPSTSEKSLRIEQSGIQKRGIQLGPEHAQGTWRVFGIFSSRPIPVEDVTPIVEAFVKTKSNPVNGDFLLQEISMEVVSP